MGLLLPGYMPRGVVAITTDLNDTAYVGDTETVVYQLPFTAAPKRIYRVHFRVGRADTYSQGDSSTRPAKSSMQVKCRWAAGSTVTTSGALIGDYRVSVFNDSSDTATGVDASFYLVNPPSGQLAVGISIYANRASATYGTVRCLADTNAHLVVEDVGPYSE
ncbi:hypothetical protein PV708_02780 [Streptomyces sp. ME02-6977A]|uniref:DUF7298 domain-containing protein n=1 Tax=Streptomyces sp. ME02-6977A TaxID=3028671 RepID=UPI0029BF3ED9|nr:hypothetical protein [Streptomyces sp. ME02-6977A]MDX3405162.1 hypothetical protein [Streptomyces sp. ME02-6977A]